MTLRNAIHEFRQLRGRSNRRSKRRLYSNFIQLLESLEFKSLSFEEMRSLERKLADLLLDLNTRSSARDLRYLLSDFKSFLKEELSLTSKGYYLYMGLVYGGSLGLFIGEILLGDIDQAMGLVIGVSVGAVVGELIGSYIEKEIEASGNLI